MLFFGTVPFTTFCVIKKKTPISGDFFGKICNKNFWKNSNSKCHKISKGFTTQISPLLSKEKFHQLTYIFMTKIKIINQSIYYNVYTKEKKLIQAQATPNASLGPVVVVPPLTLPNLLCILLIKSRYCIILISIPKKWRK